MLSAKALPMARHYRDVNHPAYGTPRNAAVEALRPEIEAVLGRRRSVAAVWAPQHTQGTIPVFRIERGTDMTFAEFFGHLTDIVEAGNEPRIAVYCDDDGQPLGIMVGRRPRVAAQSDDATDADAAHTYAVEDQPA